MTLYVVIKFLSKFKTDPFRLYTYVNKVASMTIGTSACLQEETIVSVQDLYYALMLPSGNDAAVVLGECIGTLLIYKDLNILKPKKLPELVIVPKDKSEESITRFIKEMNRTANSIGMEMTYFASVHGLMNNRNISTASDIGLLSSKAYFLLIFRTVVKT